MRLSVEIVRRRCVENATACAGTRRSHAADTAEAKPTRMDDSGFLKASACPVRDQEREQDTNRTWVSTCQLAICLRKWPPHD